MRGYIAKASIWIQAYLSSLNFFLDKLVHTMAYSIWPPAQALTYGSGLQMANKSFHFVSARFTVRPQYHFQALEFMSKEVSLS